MCIQIAHMLHALVTRYMNYLFSSSVIKVAIHAIGDKANDMILDMYESVATVNGDRDRRFRVSLIFKKKKKKTFSF